MLSATASDGIRVAYHDWGRRSGSPVVLVQGLGASSKGWLLQRGPFSRHHRVLALDNRGTGQTEMPVGGTTLFQMAEDVVSVLDAADVERAHVVGVSMGGIISQIIGVLHPERTLSLTLANTACRHHQWRRELLAEWAAAVDERGTGSLGGEALQWLIGPRVHKRFGVWLNLLAQVVMSDSPRGFIHQVDAILDMPDDLRHELHSIAVPTLVIAGSQDALTPVGDSEEIAELIPGSKLVVVTGQAHGLLAQAPLLFNRTVLDFIAEVDGLLDEREAQGLTT